MKLFRLGIIRSNAVEGRQIGEPEVCFYPYGLHLFKRGRAEMGENSESGKQVVLLELRVSRGSMVSSNKLPIYKGWARL